MANLNDRALLVILNVSQWEGRKADRKARGKVVSDHHVTDAKAVSVRKALLPNNPELKAVHEYTTQVRDWVKKRTLPWLADGTTILPAQAYMEFRTEYQQKQAHWYALVDRFLTRYDTLRSHAALTLGDMYDLADYPTPESLRDKFSIKIRFLPVPSNDFRVSLADDELQSLRDEVTADVQEAQQDAMRHLWKRLYDIVAKVASRQRVRDEQFDMLRDLCGLLPTLNYLDDPNLEAMRLEIEDKLLVSTDKQKANETVKEQVTSDAQGILDAMGAFYSPN